MTSLVSTGCDSESLSTEITNFIARWLNLEPSCIGPRLDLTDDLGLDLIEVTELVIVLEQQFCPKEEITEQQNQIGSVGDLIHHIEQQQAL